MAKGEVRPESKEGRTMSNDFERFWSVYPKRSGGNPKQPAMQKFLRAVKQGARPDDIIGGAKCYARECDAARKTGTEFVAMASTWLNQRRWMDYGAVKYRSPAEIRNNLVFVDEGSAQWQAWKKLHPLRTPMDFKIEGRYRRGWYYPSEWPQEAI